MSATSAWTREEILACRFFGDDRTKTLALLEERDAFLASLKLAEAALANAEAQRDAACAEVVDLRERCERLLRAPTEALRRDVIQTIGAALTGPSIAEQVLRERDLRVVLETDATTAAFIRGEPSATGFAVANALRERDERVRADERAAFKTVLGDAGVVRPEWLVDRLDDFTGRVWNEARAIALEEAALDIRKMIPNDDRFDEGVRASMKRIRALAKVRPSGQAEISKQIASALERSKPLVAAALKLGRSISGPDPTLSGVRITSAAPEAAAVCESCAGLGEYHYENVPQKCGSCDGTGKAAR